jgi:hypothetical protein
MLLTLTHSTEKHGPLSHISEKETRKITQLFKDMQIKITFRTWCKT